MRAPQEVVSQTCLQHPCAEGAATAAAAAAGAAVRDLGARCCLHLRTLPGAGVSGALALAVRCCGSLRLVGVSRFLRPAALHRSVSQARYMYVSCLIDWSNRQQPTHLQPASNQDWLVIL